MMRKCWCARCGQAFTIARDIVETKIKCGACGYIQPIPEPGDYPLASGPDEASFPPASGPRFPGAAEVKTDRVPRWLRGLAGERSRIQGLCVCLLVISAADLLMTYTLLRKNPSFYESNPIAGWVFSRWNVAGLVLFKFSLIALAIALGEVIERHRPRWGKAVLLVGCLVASYAFIHGFRLYLGHGLLPIGE